MFYYNKEIQAKEIGEGIKRKVLCYNEEMMVCQFTLEKGADLAAHAHPHKQSTYLVSGSCIANIDGKESLLRAGDGMMIPPNAMHSVKVLENMVAIDMFTPMREDFLDI